MMSAFMERPTEVLISYMASFKNRPERDIRDEYLHMGQLALAMEIITVVRVLDEVDVLFGSKDESISVLQTLLVDQGLMDEAVEWYERLAEWRKIKLVREGETNRHVAAYLAFDPDAQPSGSGTLPEQEPPRGSTLSQPGSDQNQDPS